MTLEVLREVFAFNQEAKDNPYRILGTVISKGICLVTGFLMDNMLFAGLSTIGMMTYVYYQNLQPRDLFRRMVTIGAAMVLGNYLGFLIPHFPWSEPIIIATIAIIARLIFRLRKSPIPGAMFVIMITTISSRMALGLHMIPKMSLYFAFGVGLAIVTAMIVQRTEKEPGAISPTGGKSTKELLYEDPGALIDSLFFGGILFIIVYISRLFNIENNTWIIVSAVPILQMPTSKAMLVRQIQRVIGALIGVVFAAVYLAFDLRPAVTIGLILLCDMGLEIFLRRNYLLGMIFIQPMVIMLLTITPAVKYESILTSRFLGILLGSLLGLLGGHLTNVALKFHLRAYHLEERELKD